VARHFWDGLTIYRINPGSLWVSLKTPQTLPPTSTAFQTAATLGWQRTACPAQPERTGPGNFTGIRIAVSAARGLSLSLGIPATGVTLFDALAVAAPLPILATLQATRHEVYVSEIHHDGRSEPQQMALGDIPPPRIAGCVCIGHRSDEVATHLGLHAHPAAHAPASAMARHVAALDRIPDARPTPYYLRPAVAAPPRDPAPVILP